VFDAIEADSPLDARQQALLAELRKLAPKRHAVAAPRARKGAPARGSRRRAAAVE
jgi:hypothetical protein